jgi:hypothetical protein
MGANLGHHGKVQMIPYEEVRRRLAALLSDASK